MYFYKEIRKKEEALAEQLSEWCKDDYNCFIQKYLLGNDYFESSVYLNHTSKKDYHRPFVRACSYAETDLSSRHLFIFPKAEDSFLFEDEKVESKEHETDIISKLREGKQNWFVWLVPNNCSYKNELQRYADSYNGTENIHAKIVFWEDLLDEYAKIRKNYAAEKETRLTYKLLSQAVRSIKDFYPAESQMNELLITANSFNLSCCLHNRFPDKQAVLELELNPVEENLDDAVENKLNKRIEEIKNAGKILLVLDDDCEGKALKDSVIKYFRKNHPSMIEEKRIETVTFPKYFIEPYLDSSTADTIQEVEKVLEEWDEDSFEDYSESLKIKKGISIFEEMGDFVEYYFDDVLNRYKNRKIVE